MEVTFTIKKYCKDESEVERIMDELNSTYDVIDISASADEFGELTVYGTDSHLTKLRRGKR